MPEAFTIRNLLLIATLAPLLSATAIIVGTRRAIAPRAAGWLATGVMAGAFACCVYALFLWMGLPGQRPTIVSHLPWIPVPGLGEDGYLTLGILIDGLTMAMMPMVSGIAMLVHLYSIGYMAGDKRYHWFFAYLSLFSFSMMGIVISNSLVQLFVFWELVGLTSYLLIGFWFEKRGPQLACKKAFVMNRIGDAGFLIGFGILFTQLGGKVLLPAAEGVIPLGGDQASLSMYGALTRSALDGGLGLDILHPPLWLTLAGIGLFFGAVGKSAQFPLHTWLPDAMEGPTPVSSIVHSATMVAAGVYLTGRIYPILTPAAHLYIALIGMITLVMAACMALVMTDIKRVLAYSTLSQLGYMVLGLGSGMYAFALFHLITHAFFKCCLFQCAGSVIHAAGHQQDMRCYGGLWRKLPVTAACFLVCTLAIAGASIPFTGVGLSGFYSKDGIIAGTWFYGTALSPASPWGRLFYLAPTVVAFLTVFYMGRSFALTFLGKPRDQRLFDHAHESPWTMIVPQAALAFMAVVAALFPFLSLIQDSQPDVSWVLPAESAGLEHGLHYVHAALLHGFAWLLMLGAAVAIYTPGLGLAQRMVAAVPGLGLLHRWALNKFYFDALFDVALVSVAKAAAFLLAAIDKHVVDGLVNLAGASTRLSSLAARLFDNAVVDGAVNGLAATAQGSGQALRATQAGRIRGYVMLLFASSAVLIVAVVTAVLVMR